MLFGATAGAQEATNGPAATVDRLFAAVAAHDTQTVRGSFVPDAMLFGIKGDGTPYAIPFERWVKAIDQSKDSWLERTWNPNVLLHDSVAAVWAEYDFYLNGKFSHCGIDSFNLLKTSEGWKIAAISDTEEKSGCAPSPLGPPSSAGKASPPTR